MAIEFRLPDLGENIEAGEVLNVLVSAGQILSEDEPVIELETDKAVIEVPSSVAGKIVSVHVGKGDRAAVGQTILTLEPDPGETAKGPEASRPDPPSPAATDTTGVQQRSVQFRTLVLHESSEISTHQPWKECSPWC